MFSKLLHNLFQHSHWLLLGVIIFTVSCSPTRRIAEGEYLLDKTKVELDSKKVDKKELKKYEKQSPNKTILGFKFHLFLFNLASPKREKFPSAWFRRIGEEPVIWDELLTESTTDQYRKYLETKGYYETAIEDTVARKKKRAKIEHQIQLGEPHTINEITYKFEDQKIAELILSDTTNCLIQPGDRFDKEIIQAERQRLELFMKNRGYFRFNKEYIFYDAVETVNRKQVNLNITIRENVTGYPDPVTKVKHHYQYKINETFVNTNFTFFSDLSEAEKQNADTIDLGQNHVIYSGDHKIRPEAVLHPNLSNPGRIYNLQDVKKSYSNYSSLGLYRIINIHFNELDNRLADTSEYRYIDGVVELSPRKKQAYQYEIVGTNSAGDLGARLNISYNNYNLIRGAENFQIKLTGAIEAMKKREKREVAPMKQFGIETSLTFPKFLVPFNAERFTRKFNPRTIINISYNYQDRPDYIRTIASTSFGYKWKGNEYNLHQLIPVDFNYVRLPDSINDPNLWNDIVGTPLQNSFTDHSILSARYVFEFSNQRIEKLSDFVYIRINLESAGNMVYGIGKLFPVNSDSTLFNVPYFQYLKSDLDLRFHNQITPDNKIVYRIFMGIGYPVGNSETLPFEKMYFSGGPYGIRAWSTRTLGPGSDTTATSMYANNLGDIRLEANMEYRFKLFWKLEGAFFIDAGNIWTIKNYSNRPGSSFEWDRFYKEIAVGTGLGVRLDFSFLLLRTDFGFKLRDPSIQQGSRWIDFNGNEYEDGRFVFQFGIGYPF